MSDYTYDDVISALDIKRGKANADELICKKGYFIDKLNEFICGELEGKLPIRTLTAVNADNTCQVFCSDTRIWWEYFIPLKEADSYKYEQEAWLKENGLKIGDKVRIARKQESNDPYWPNWWSPDMDGLIGEEMTINKVTPTGISFKETFFDWPYFCLEPIKEKGVKVGDFVRTRGGDIGVVSEIREDDLIVRTNQIIWMPCRGEKLTHIHAHIEPFDFDDSRTRGLLRGKWVRHDFGLKDGEFKEEMIIGFENRGCDYRLSNPVEAMTNGPEVFILGDRFTPDDFLKECTFLDGTPCGIVVEDEE